MSASTDILGAIAVARKAGRSIDPVIEELFAVLARRIDDLSPKADAPAKPVADPVKP